MNLPLNSEQYSGINAADGQHSGQTKSRDIIRNMHFSDWTSPSRMLGCLEVIRLGRLSSTTREGCISVQLIPH
jgi:hypothetical protein